MGLAHTDDRLTPRPALLEVVETPAERGERVISRELDRLELARGEQPQQILPHLCEALRVLR